MKIVIDIDKQDYEDIQVLYNVCDYENHLMLVDRICSRVVHGTVLPKHGRLIDADALIKVTETMYLEGDSPLSFRVDGNTEDTLIGKFQMIDTIFDAPTILEPTET